MEQVFARLLDRVSDAYRDAGGELRALGQTGSDKHSVEAGPEPLPELVGARQRAVVKALQDAGTDGITAAEIAFKTGYERANLYATLDRLVELGVSEVVPRSNPRRWRLAPRFRPAE